MLWLDKASLANCFHIGAATMVASAVGLSAICAPSAKPAEQAVVRANLQAKTTATRPAVELLPDVKPQPIPVQPPVNCAAEACLALTFDDGPEAHTTPQLLDILAAHQVKATFFMLGSQAAKYPDIVKRVKQAGHEIGNHSWHHGYYTKMTPEQMIEDFTRAQASLEAGAEPVKLFRPPYGARDDTVRQTVPLSIILWNVDPEDWRESDPSQLATRVVATAKPGGIVVLHDIKPVTVAAAPHFIPTLKQHYRLVTVSQLLDLKPDSPKAEYHGR